MKQWFATIAAAAATAAGAADFTDIAQVIAATPIMERVTEPRRDCSPGPRERGPQGPDGGSTDTAQANHDNAGRAARCRTVESEREIVRGYSVVYRYKGREGTTVMAYDPGPTLRVGVSALDGQRAHPARGDTLRGSNVRDLSPPPADPAPPRTTPAGDYSYRY